MTTITDTAKDLIHAVKTADAPEPSNPNLTARIDIRWGNGQSEIVWVRAGGDMIGHGGTVQSRMARMIQDTWQRLQSETPKQTEHGYPNYLYVIDHGSATISDMAPHDERLPLIVKQAKAVLPCHLPSRAAAAFLCITSDV